MKIAKLIGNPTVGYRIPVTLEIRSATELGLRVSNDEDIPDLPVEAGNIYMSREGEILNPWEFRVIKARSELHPSTEVLVYVVPEECVALMQTIDATLTRACLCLTGKLGKQTGKTEQLQDTHCAPLFFAIFGDGDENKRARKLIAKYLRVHPSNISMPHLQKACGAFSKSTFDKIKGRLNLTDARTSQAVAEAETEQKADNESDSLYTDHTYGQDDLF